MISALHFLPVQTAAQLAKSCRIQYLLRISNLHNISAATKDHGSISSWSGHWEEGACVILTGCYLNSIHKGTWVPKLQVALSPRREVGNGMPKGRVAPGVVPLWPRHFCLVMILLLFTWQPQKGTKLRLNMNMITYQNEYLEAKQGTKYASCTPLSYTEIVPCISISSLFSPIKLWNNWKLQNTMIFRACIPSFIKQIFLATHFSNPALKCHPFSGTTLNSPFWIAV